MKDAGEILRFAASPHTLDSTARDPVITRVIAVASIAIVYEYESIAMT